MELEEAVKRHGKQGLKIELLISSLTSFFLLLDEVSFVSPQMVVKCQLL